MNNSISKNENEYRCQIESNIILHIKRMNHPIAMLYFTDEMDNKINIPTNIVVYKYNYNSYQKVILKSSHEIYALYWKDNYAIEYNDKKIIDIENRRRWTVYLK